MTDDPKKELLSLLARIDQQIAEAETLTTEAIEDEAKQWRVAMQLASLRDALTRVENLVGNK